MTFVPTGSAELDRILAERERIRAAWRAPRLRIAPPRIPTFPPLPLAAPKPFKQRLAEADALRGQLPSAILKEIKWCMRQSAQDCGELPAPEIKQYYPGPTVIKIQCVVAEHFGISADELLSPGRALHIIRPRDIAMYLAKNLTRRSLVDIGRRFNGRDHVTLLHAIRRVELRIAESWWLAQEIEMLRRNLES